MSTWARTQSGDMYLPPNGEGGEAIVTDPVLCAQIKIPSVLRFVKGEWSLNTAEGFDWLPIWEAKRPSQDAVRLAVRKAILAITQPPIASMTDLSTAYDPVTRNLGYQAKAVLASGETVSVP